MLLVVFPATFTGTNTEMQFPIKNLYFRFKFQIPVYNECSMTFTWKCSCEYGLHIREYGLHIHQGSTLTVAQLPGATDFRSGQVTKYSQWPTGQ